MANLIFWRHAEAEIESSTGRDSDRALTKRGRKDALKMAKWLHRHLPIDTQVLCSPARRCQETAATLQSINADDGEHRKPLDINVAEFLSIDSRLEDIAQKLVNDDSSKTILIVGHEPNLGRLISQLLGMEKNVCAVKKGAVWWLRQKVVSGALQTYLFTVQLPRY
ncbi:MAG: histidine phosphatase family protein [Pseudomonadota bacterium]